MFNLPSCCTYHAPTNLSIDSPVENNESGKGNEVHDDEVSPIDVDADVERVLSHGTHRIVINCFIEIHVKALHTGTYFEPSREIVQDGEGEYCADTVAGSTPGTERSCTERVTYCHVALNSDGQGQVHGSRLG